MNGSMAAPALGLSATDALAAAIARHAARPGDHQTALAALSLHRRNGPTEPIPCTYPLGLAVTAQGDKQVLFGERVLGYRPGQSMLTTVELPVVSHVTRASVREPYLALLLRLDPRSVLAAAAAMKLPRSDPADAPVEISVERLDPALLDALRRLVDLLDEPALLPHLAPLIQQEIAARLLVGPHAAHLRQLLGDRTPAERIAHAVTWMKENIASPIRIETLAAEAHMSLSAFRQHFRAVTGMSPLKYRKQLRLQEARQLLLNRNLDAGRAAGLVGYESASQFSRDYSRLFGAPPQRDLRRLREAV